MKRRLALGVALVALLTSEQQALAQAQSTDLGDIVVTARKREESVLSVPVVASVLSQEAMETRQLVDLREVARVVPGLALTEAVGTLGTQVSLRGVGTSAVNATIDASVSLNIDGLPMTQGTSYSAAMFDLARIEVLKGPQSLFYGKNSPGGVIAVRSADPTDEFELIARSGYEAKARQLRSEIILSGPISETLKLRVAGLYDFQDGFFKNVGSVPGGLGGVAPTDQRSPSNKNYLIRGTALWNPTADISARLKVNFSHDRTDGGESYQLTSCPDGIGAVPGTDIPFIAPHEDCTLNRTVNNIYADPVAFPGARNNGVPFKRLNQRFGTFELGFNLADDLSLTSTTGYYHTFFKSLVASTGSYAGPTFLSVGNLDRKQYTQEIRLASDSSAPLNFMAGFFFEDGQIFHRQDLPTNRVFAGLPTTLGTYQQFIDITSYSAFGQLRWKVIPELELAAGARWTNEKRKMTAYRLETGSPVLFPTAVPEIESDNIAPELTATYQPSDDLTLFASYKIAYKSGSFDTTALRGVFPDYSFDDEKGEGGEIGIKARLFDRSLLANFAIFNYRYTGLQVGVVEPHTDGVPINRTLNAGSAKTYGVDFEMTYVPSSIDGFMVQAAVAYTRARFQNLESVPCWDGQTIAEGCNQALNPTTSRFTAQNLSGLPLVRAPKWQANFGFSYELPVGDDMVLALNSANQYASSYLTTLGRRKDFFRNGFFKTDLSAAVRGANERWELALIGKNLTNKITSFNCSASNVANGAVFGGTLTGGSVRGPAGVAEVGCFADRGRELWVRMTFRPFR